MHGWPEEEEEVRRKVAYLNLHSTPGNRGEQGGLSLAKRTTRDLATANQ